MQFRSILSVCFILSLLVTSSCIVSQPMQIPQGFPETVNLEDLKFTVESVSGQVQVKPNWEAPWQPLRGGEVFDGFALVRSGFRSNATLVLNYGEQSCKCKIGDLLCQVSLAEVYDKLLCSSGIAKYHKKIWGKGEKIDAEAPILACRETLNGTDDEKLSQNSLLAAAGDMIYGYSSTQREVGGAAGGGAAAAAAGSSSGASTGSSGGGGGCPGGG